MAEDPFSEIWQEADEICIKLGLSAGQYDEALTILRGNNKA